MHEVNFENLFKDMFDYIMCTINVISVYFMYIETFSLSTAYHVRAKKKLIARI